jgi:hypothetical protein
MPRLRRVPAPCRTKTFSRPSRGHTAFGGVVAYFTKGRPAISITSTEARTPRSLERLSTIVPMARNRTPASSKCRAPGRRVGLGLVLPP